MDRVDFFFRQIVTEAEMDEAFSKAEAGDQKIMTDQLLIGVQVGGEVAEHFTPPDLTVDIAGPCVAYDQAGQRMFFSPLQVLDMSIDENGVTTTVGTPGNEKTLAIFLEFDRSLSDPRLDGNSVTVFYQRTESFKLNVVQSAELVIPTSVPPPLRVDQILLADVVIINAQTAILDADIDDSRREDVYDLTGTPNAIKAGRTQAVLQAFLDLINLGAATISYAGGPAWHDTTTNPATTVELQLDKIITDLVDNAGADRIGASTGPAWHDATAVAAGSIEDRLDQIITDLVANAGDDRIGVLATGGGIVTAGGSIHDALTEMETAVLAKSTNDGRYQLDVAGATSQGTWVLDTTTGAADYPHYHITGVNGNLLIIPLSTIGIVGARIDSCQIIIEGASGEQCEFRMFQYTHSGAARVRTGLGAGVITADPLGTIVPTNQPAIAHVIVVNSRYAIEVESTLGAGIRRILNASVVLDLAP